MATASPTSIDSRRSRYGGVAVDVGGRERRVADGGLRDRLDQQVVDADLRAAAGRLRVLLGQQVRRVDVADEVVLRDQLAGGHAPRDRAPRGGELLAAGAGRLGRRRRAAGRGGLDVVERDPPARAGAGDGRRGRRRAWPRPGARPGRRAGGGARRAAVPDAAATAAGGAAASRAGSAAGGGPLRLRRRLAAPRREPQQHGADRHGVAGRDLDRLDDAVLGRDDVGDRLVGLELDQRLVAPAPRAPTSTKTALTRPLGDLEPELRQQHGSCLTSYCRTVTLHIATMTSH